MKRVGDDAKASCTARFLVGLPCDAGWGIG